MNKDDETRMELSNSIFYDRNTINKNINDIKYNLKTILFLLTQLEKHTCFSNDLTDKADVLAEYNDNLRLLIENTGGLNDNIQYDIEDIIEKQRQLTLLDDDERHTEVKNLNGVII